MARRTGATRPTATQTGSVICCIAGHASWRYQESRPKHLECPSIRQPANARVCSSYSARKACIGLILVARLAGSHAAAMVITVTATMAMEIAVGSSGLKS